MGRLGLIAIALGHTGAFCPALTYAQLPPGCVGEVPVEIVTSPPAGAVGVALDSPIHIRVIGDDAPSFALFREADEVTDAGVADAGLAPPPLRTVVAAHWQRLGATDRFVVTPDQLLDPDVDYVITIDAGGLGLRTDRRFKTGNAVDSGPPVFEFGPERITEFSSSPIPEECGEGGGSRRISISFDDATDDANEGGIEYLLYLTRAAGLEAPRLMTRRYLAEASSMTFLLTSEQLLTPVCVVVDAVDGVGNHAEDIEEYCFDPLQGNFFEPCSVGSLVNTAQSRWFVAYMFAVMVALGVRMRRLQRRTPR